MRIVVIDYGMGNLRSVQKAFERLNLPASVVSSPSGLEDADKIILPGVGHFAYGMKNLAEKGWTDALKEAVLVRKKHLLGICLGMQLLTRCSEEGQVDGLGFVEAETKGFHGEIEGLKVPHMGWNEVNVAKRTSLSVALKGDEMVYFVHSYFVRCRHRDDVLLTTDYGITFDSAFQHENIAGFQFHPEKSHQTGLALLHQFITL